MIGTTAEGIRRLSEARAEKRLIVLRGGEDMVNVPAESQSSLNDADGIPLFVFGLHSPWDSTVRRFPAPGG